MIFTRFQNICEGGHLGFPLTYALPSQYPYPLLIAGSQSAGGPSAIQSYGWQRTDAGHSLFINPGAPPKVLQNSNTLTTPCRLYTPYNVWKQVCNMVGEGDWVNGGYSMTMYPYQTEENISYNASFGQQQDGKWPMTAVAIIDREDQATYGEIDGVKHLPGIHPIESLITYEGDTWVILNNVFREQDNSFFAVRLS